MEDSKCKESNIFCLVIEMFKYAYSGEQHKGTRIELNFVAYLLVVLTVLATLFLDNNTPKVDITFMTFTSLFMACHCISSKLMYDLVYPEGGLRSADFSLTHIGEKSCNMLLLTFMFFVYGLLALYTIIQYGNISDYVIYLWSYTAIAFIIVCLTCMEHLRSLEPESKFYKVYWVCRNAISSAFNCCLFLFIVVMITTPVTYIMIISKSSTLYISLAIISILNLILLSTVNKINPLLLYKQEKEKLK